MARAAGRTSAGCTRRAAPQVVEAQAQPDHPPDMAARREGDDPADAIDRALDGLVTMAAGLMRLEEVITRMDERSRRNLPPSA